MRAQNRRKMQVLKEISFRRRSQFPKTLINQINSSKKTHRLSKRLLRVLEEQRKMEINRMENTLLDTNNLKQRRGKQRMKKRKH